MEKTYVIEFLESKKRRKIIARQAFWHKVHSFINPLYWLKKLANKIAENKHEGNKADALNVHFELAKAVARLKVDRKHLIHLINTSKNNEDRKELNDLLNKVDRQLNEHLQAK
jgi:hypothetical protein